MTLTREQQVFICGVLRLLPLPDDVPQTGGPVGQQGERQHQQGQNDQAVLGIPEKRMEDDAVACFPWIWYIFEIRSVK